jgi:SAM-dependent methyltransferase
MSTSDSFWDFYWEIRLKDMETLGKREAILAGSKLILQQAKQRGPDQPVRMLELGCGEAQILGALAEAHTQIPGIDQSVGVDYLHSSIETCQRNYPRLRFIEGDFTDPDLLASLSSFEILLLVNALHEVFSFTFSEALGEVDIPLAKHRVQQALTGAVQLLVPGGYVLLFDGLETPGDISEPLRVRFLHPQAREHFETFAREYRPLRIHYQPTSDPMCVELSRRDFTRYITKSIFLGKKLWQSERFESYQYYNEQEFRSAFAQAGLTIRELRTLTVNDNKWNSFVEIETPGVSFPAEHILILAQKTQ